MTSVNNVNRSLTTSRSIINSFLKVIALMCLFTTAGFVGDPSGLANDKKIATQVAAFSSFAVSDKEEVKPSSLLVLSLPTIVGIKTDTNISFLEKKINLPLLVENHSGRLPEEEEVFVYTNSSNVFIPDRHPLVRPFLPNSNLSNGSLSSEEPELYITQVASAVYLGLEQGLKWVDNSVVKVAHFMKTTLLDEIVLRFECIHQRRPSWFYPHRHLRHDPHVINHYMVNRFAGFVRSYKRETEKIKTHVAAFLVAAVPLAEILNDGYIFIWSAMTMKNSFIILMILVSWIFIFHSVMAIVYWKKINSVLSRQREGSEAPLPKSSSPLLPQDLIDDDEDSDMIMQKEFVPAEEEENAATAENWQIVGFPWTRSCREMLPFEVREYCIRYTKYHAKWTNSLNRRYPGGDPAFLVSRMVTRRMNLFYNSTLTTIMEEEVEEEEEREVALEEDVHAVVVGGEEEEEEEEDDDASLDAMFFDANDEEYEEDVEMVHPDNDDDEDDEESLCLLETTATTPGTVTSTTGTAIITTTTGATSTKDVSMSTYSGRGKENKTHEETVGTFSPSVQLQEGQGVTVTVEDEEITTNNSLLGSGFYIDDKGRKRRFSYRLLVEKKSGKCAATKGRRTRKARMD